jgi:ferritin-like metal-binding protein YciE
MGGIVRSDNALHNANCLAAEVVRQSALSGSPTQAAVNAAEIAYYRSVIASARANNCGVEASLSALIALGVAP